MYELRTDSPISYEDLEDNGGDLEVDWIIVKLNRGSGVEISQRLYVGKGSISSLHILAAVELVRLLNDLPKVEK